jgi:sterol desaturase/sphingolipid hydroxylase (fatty acid hydroxylase superfamily)
MCLIITCINVSIKSLKNFIFINGLLITIAKLQTLYNSCFFIMARNILLCRFVDHVTKDKPSLAKFWEKINWIELYFYLIIASVIEYYLICFLKYKKPDSNYDIIMFLMLSFPFEIIFDLFHYVAHRLLHNKVLYQYIHKHHHTYKDVIPIMAFYQNPIDLLLSNVIPFYLTYSIFSIFYDQSALFVSLTLTYKIFIEIAGHCGKDAKASSFPQCIWLPQFFGFELKSKNHDLHHKDGRYNYSKRFMLWDYVFKTDYKLSIQ